MSMSEEREQQVKQLLDNRLEEINDDQELINQLKRARKNALAHAKKNPIRQYGPVMGWAIAASLVLILVIPRLGEDNGKGFDVMQDISLTDFELVSELELFEDDLEFYFWLEETDAFSG